MKPTFQSNANVFLQHAESPEGGDSWLGSNPVTDIARAMVEAAMEII